MKTCTKVYSDIPFAHRQQNHDGHCAYIHGHNWSISLTFSASRLDDNGFVVDFGKLKYIKEYIEKHLDHACVLSKTDPCVTVFAESPYFKLFTIEDCSCEGLACFLFHEFNSILEGKEFGRVKIVEVTVTEDSKNSASYRE